MVILLFWDDLMIFTYCRKWWRKKKINFFGLQLCFLGQALQVGFAVQITMAITISNTEIDTEVTLDRLNIRNLNSEADFLL